MMELKRGSGNRKNVLNEADISSDSGSLQWQSSLVITTADCPIFSHKHGK